MVGLGHPQAEKLDRGDYRRKAKSPCELLPIVLSTLPISPLCRYDVRYSSISSVLQHKIYHLRRTHAEQERGFKTLPAILWP